MYAFAFWDMKKAVLLGGKDRFKRRRSIFCENCPKKNFIFVNIVNCYFVSKHDTMNIPEQNRNSSGSSGETSLYYPHTEKGERYEKDMSLCKRRTPSGICPRAAGHRR
jgi:hypothetical protein